TASRPKLSRNGPTSGSRPEKPEAVRCNLTAPDTTSYRPPHNLTGVREMTTTATKKASKPKAATPAKKPAASREQQLVVKLGKDGSIPRIIVLGRGQLAGRKLFATRLP